MSKLFNKTIVLLMVLLLANTLLFAINNNQRILDIDSDVYNGIRDLYLSQGLAQPSSAAPYSDSELYMMLELLDTSKFSKADTKVYEYILDSLELDDRNNTKLGKIEWNPTINVESYNHTNTTDFLTRDNWIYDFQDQEQFLSLDVEAWTGSFFYGLGNFSIGTTYTTENTFGITNFNSNLLFLYPNKIIDLDFNFPYRAFIAVGDDSWSLQIGRDRVKWGSGVTSNLMIGDNLKYLDELRYTTYSNQFKYTYLLSFFPYPSNYINSSDYDATTGLGQGNEVSGTRALIAHRGEGRLFNNKVGLALNESIMYQSEENVLDLRYLSPTALFHNYYIRANANSLVTLELDYTPIKNFNIYGQVAVDEFSLPGEPVQGVSSLANPKALGYLGGVRYHYDVADKYKGNTSLELAYTDPYLYLRGSGTYNDSTQESDEYGINYVVAFREFAEGTYYHSEYLGYEYGGDAIVANINSTLVNYGKWNIEANIFYMLHGTFDMFTCWQQIEDTDDPSSYTTPTTSNDNDSNNSDNVDNSAKDSVSRTLVIGGSVSYDLTEKINCFVQLDYINIKNYENISGENTQDLQLVLSLSYSI
ncbi:MAG: hypothetical protein ACPKM0_09315 [Pleomorphochaeta sp.]